MRRNKNDKKDPYPENGFEEWVSLVFIILLHSLGWDGKVKCFILRKFPRRNKSHIY